MKKLLTLCMLLCTVFTGAWAEDWTVNIPDGTVSVSSSKANSVTAATSADDNNHWYVMQQDRGRLTPVVAPATTDGGINRESNALSSYITNGSTSTASAKKYLVRLVPSGTENVYYIQFGTGLYFGHTAATLTLNSGSGTALNARAYADADKYFVYNIANSDTHIGVSYTEDNLNHTARLDNNGNGSGLSYWTSGQKTTTGGNDDWSFYPVDFDFTVQMAQITYKYTNNGQTWYTENARTVTVGQPYPDLLLPYGVTGTKPAGNVPSGDATVEIPVTYTKGNRGFDFSADYEHAKWHKWYKRYSWQNTVRSELFYVESANYINQNKDNTDNTTDEYLWAAVGNPFDFVIINRAAGSDKYLSNPNNSVGDSNEPYMQTQSEKNQHYFLYDCTNAGNTWGDMNFCIINASTHTTLSGNGHLNYWVNNNAWGDDGSRMIWEWVMDEPEGIPVTFNYISSHGASWSVEKNFEEGHSLVEGDYAVDFYNNYNVTPNTPVSENNKTFTITCDDHFPFTPGEPCRLQTKRDVSVGGDFYVTESGQAYAKKNTTTYEDNRNIWVIEHVEKTPYLFTIRSFYNNQYITLTSASGDAAQATMSATKQGTWQAPFESENTSYLKFRNSTAPKGDGGFCLTHPKNDHVCCAIHYTPSDSEKETIGYGVGGWGNGDVDRDDNALFVYQIESFTANLAATDGTDNYGSIYLPYTMTLPAGVEAYAAAKEGEVLKLTKVGEAGAVIPEGAYILYSADETSATLALGAANPVTVESNALDGKFQTGVNLPEGNNYVLNDKGGVVGFYKYSKATYPVAKAVFCAGTGSSVSAFRFDFDTEQTTSIESLIQNMRLQGEVFDLQGRHLNKAQKGMNIINGHKVLVK